jgi:hypothetical protein
MATVEILSALALGGLMGLVGQGSRAVIGLKKLNDSNQKSDPAQSEVFVASRLLVSLMIGFISGVAASVAMGLDKLVNISVDNLDVLLSIAAVGYAGTDAIEAFIARIGPVSAPTTTVQSTDTKQQTPAPDGVSAPPHGTPPSPAPKDGSAPPPGGTPPGAPPPTDPDLEATIAEMRSDMAFIRSNIEETTSSAMPLVAKVGDIFDDVTPEVVKEMFVPATPLSNIRKHLPNVIAGLRLKRLVDRSMLLMALATIRAESEGFLPISEAISSFNTDKEPFDKYEKGTPIGKKLGNTQVGDGARFRGRGFVQLTGRDNYQRVGDQLSMDLTGNPALANDSVAAGTVLAQFLLNHESDIRAALKQGDLKTARRLVNGGSHGFARFKDAFEKGEQLFPEAKTLDA